ncbi:MAG: hypothetical protein ACYTGZ_12345 [Planctomycetota bacterium]|jgi:hypothetical protein
MAATIGGALVLALCGSTDAWGQAARPAPVALKDVVKFGQKLPALLAKSVPESAVIVVQSVAAATAYSGAGQRNEITKTGTLTQQTAGRGSYSYSPEPRDRLVLKLKGQPAQSIFVRDAWGNMGAASASDFLEANHSLAYRHVIPNRVDVNIISRRTGGRWASSVKGTVVRHGKKFMVDIKGAGTTYFESSLRGAEKRNNYTLKGTLRAGDLAVTVDERYKFEMVSHGGESVSHSVDWFKNKLTLPGGDAFEWSNCRIAKVFKNGRPSSVGRDWHGDGRILRNGQPYAAFKLKESGLKFVIEAGQETVVLQKWG